MKHDSQGFLTGEAVDIQSAVSILRGIHSDVRAIKRALYGLKSPTQKATKAADTSNGNTDRARPQKAEKTTTQSQRTVVTPSGRKSGEKLPPQNRAQARGSSGPTAATEQTTSTAGSQDNNPEPALPSNNQTSEQIIPQPPAKTVEPEGRRKNKEEGKKRDKNGRFIKDGTDGGGHSRDSSSASDGSESMLGRLVSAISEAGSSTEEMDPTVKAFNEIAQPMARGYEMLTGGSHEKKQEGLLRRILGSLNLFRKEEDAAAKKTNKSLKNLEEKPEGESESSSGGWIAAIIGILFAKFMSGLNLIKSGLTGAAAKGGGALAKAGKFFGIGKGAAAASEAGIAAKEAGAIGSAAKEGSALSKLLAGPLQRGLSKLPLIGNVLSLLGTSAEVYASESDGNATRDEKDRRTGRAVGGLGGMFAGMSAGGALGATIGTAIFPGVGTAIGGALGGVVGAFLGDEAGKIIGETLGGWVSAIRNKDIAGTISKSWNGFVDSVSSAGKSAWESFKSLGDQANELIKQWASIDIKALFQPVLDALLSAANGLMTWLSSKTSRALNKAKEVASGALNKAKEVASGALSKTKEVVGGALGKAKDVAGRAWEATKSAAGKVLEAGKGFTTVENADGSVEKREGARNWRNNNPGNIEAGKFATKMGAIGSDGRFAIFPDYQTGRNAKEKLIFEGNGGRSLGTKADYGAGLGYKDKMLTQAIAAYAPPEDKNDLAAYQKKVLAAVGGQNKKMSEYTPAERQRIMTAMEQQEGFKVGKVTTLKQATAPVTAQATATATPAAPNATLVPAKAPFVPTASSAKVAMPNVTVPAPPSVPRVPTIADAPSIPEIIASAKQPERPQGGKGLAQDIGQDVKDRRIAHIVTGGIGGG